MSRVQVPSWVQKLAPTPATMAHLETVQPVAHVGKAVLGGDIIHEHHSISLAEQLPCHAVVPAQRKSEVRPGGLTPGPGLCKPQTLHLQSWTINFPASNCFPKRVCMCFSFLQSSYCCIGNGFNFKRYQRAPSEKSVPAPPPPPSSSHPAPPHPILPEAIRVTSFSNIFPKLFYECT